MKTETVYKGIPFKKYIYCYYDRNSRQLYMSNWNFVSLLSDSTFIKLLCLFRIEKSAKTESQRTRKNSILKSKELHRWKVNHFTSNLYLKRCSLVKQNSILKNNAL